MTNEPVQSAGAALTASQPRFKVTIPESARMLATDPKDVVLRGITMNEEKLAHKVAESGATSVAYELLKHSVIEADGQKLTWENNAKGQFVESLSHKVRELLMRAYARIHIPSDEEEADFFASLTPIV